MYKVAVCITNKDLLFKIQNIISAFFQKLKIKNDIFTFSTPETLISSLKSENFSVDSIIIDTHLNNVNGINLIYDLRKHGLTSSVIYLSQSKDLAFDAIKTDVFRYIVKKDCDKMLPQALLLDYKKNHQPRFLSIKHDNQTKKMEISKILYLEISNRGSNIECIDKTFHLPIKMVELIARLPKEIFCRCHFSFCVNIQKVVAIKRYEAILETGVSVPISKTRYDEVKNMFLTLLN